MKKLPLPLLFLLLPTAAWAGVLCEILDALYIYAQILLVSVILLACLGMRLKKFPKKYFIRLILIILYGAFLGTLLKGWYKIPESLILYAMNISWAAAGLVFLGSIIFCAYCLSTKKLSTHYTVILFTIAASLGMCAACIVVMNFDDPCSPVYISDLINRHP